MSARSRIDWGRLTRRSLRFFDKLAAGFNPVVVRIAGKRKSVTSLGEEISAETDLLVRRLECRFCPG